MRGLIEKDLRLILSRKQTLLIFFAMALVMGIAMDGSFIVGYLTMLATIIGIGTISYDEFDNGYAFLMTLPFDRKTYVREKYLFCFLMALVAWVIGTVIYLIGEGQGSQLAELPMLMAVIPILYVSTSIMIPLQLKYGSERSRIVLFILFGLIAIMVFGINKVSDGSDSFLSEMEKTLGSMPPGGILIALTSASLLVAFISYMISVRIMEKKEF